MPEPTTPTTRRDARIRRRAACALGPAIAALLVASCTGAVSGHQASSTAPTGPCTTVASDRAATLALKMTSALQHHDRSAWVGLFTGSKTLTTVSTWYDNVSAVGFSTAAVGPVDVDTPYESTTPRTQQLEVAIGLHNAFDEGFDAELGPTAPATRYRLGTDIVRDPGGACHLRPTSWTSLNTAPWDSAHRLTVVKTPHVVVAGDAAVAGDVKRVSVLAERAARFLFGFYRTIHRSDDIRVSGFVLFVPTTAAQNNSWFSYGSSSRPGGWTADAGTTAAGIEYPLSGAQLPVIVPRGAPTVSKVSEIGGGRAVITRTGLSASPSEQTATLVHEFTHYLYNNYNSGWFTGKSVDAALAEGAARYVETFYEINPDPTATTVRTMTRLAPALRPSFARFRGAEPTESQIYGSATDANFYYDLAATSFSYLSSRFGITFAFQSIRFAYANGGGPFSGIVGSKKGSSITFDSEGPYLRAWATWLRAQVR